MRPNVDAVSADTVSLLPGRPLRGQTGTNNPTHPARVPPGNRVLAALPPRETDLLRPHLTRASLVRGQSLYEPGQPIGHVFFIERGFASTVVSAGVVSAGVVSAGIGVGSAEAGLIGRESLVGLEIVLAEHAQSFGSVVMQTPGTALSVPAATLRPLLDQLPALRQACLTAAAIRLVQLEQSVVCNARHGVRERLARWLLMADDRTDTKSMPLTQDALSSILAAGRTSVNNAMGDLFDAGIVRGWRGHLTVCDRPGLEALACDCYRRTEAFAASLTSSAGDVTDPCRVG